MANLSEKSPCLLPVVVVVDVVVKPIRVPHIEDEDEEDSMSRAESFKNSTSEKSTRRAKVARAMLSTSSPNRSQNGTLDSAKVTTQARTAVNAALDTPGVESSAEAAQILLKLASYATRLVYPDLTKEAQQNETNKYIIESMVAMRDSLTKDNKNGKKGGTDDNEDRYLKKVFMALAADAIKKGADATNVYSTFNMNKNQRQTFDQDTSQAHYDELCEEAKAARAKMLARLERQHYFYRCIET